MNIPFVDLIKISNSVSILTYYGKMSSGEEFFAYVKCDSDNARKMYNDFANNVAKHPTQYGTMIYRDSIAKPDEKAQAFLKKYLEEAN